MLTFINVMFGVIAALVVSAIVINETKTKDVDEKF